VPAAAFYDLEDAVLFDDSDAAWADAGTTITEVFDDVWVVYMPISHCQGCFRACKVVATPQFVGATTSTRPPDHRGARLPPTRARPPARPPRRAAPRPRPRPRPRPPAAGRRATGDGDGATGRRRRGVRCEETEAVLADSGPQTRWTST